MANYKISGIQQVGIGTEDIKAAWKWYADMFNMNVRILEDDAVADLMLSYTDGKPQKRNACITANLQGGGGFELWQYSERKPQPIGFDISLGDIGICMAKIKSHNIEAYHEQLSQKWSQISPIVTDPRGLPTFFVIDPYGNYFQIVEDNYVFLDENNYSGGVVGAVIGVSDIDKSLTLYRDILNYDAVLYDGNGIYNDWQFLRGGGGTFRRVILGRSEPHVGAFSELYGTGTIELVQAMDRTPRRMYEDRAWGDPGFIQIGFDVIDMKAVEASCLEKGCPFTVNSGNAFEMGEATAHFAYVEDPDGTLVEFVEAYKIPVVSELNLCVDLMKRDRTKPLSKNLFRMMKLNKVKFK